MTDVCRKRALLLVAAYAVASPTVKAMAASNPSPSAFSGDARLRIELRESDAAHETLRGRLRLREELRVDGEGGWALALGLSTGRRGDPRDPDWWLGNGAPEAIVRPSPAWLRWRASEGDHTASITAGRLPMPCLRVHDLVFDGDWHPIGLSADGSLGPGNAMVRAHVGTFWLMDMGEPAWRLHTAQVAWDWMPSREWRGLFGGSLFWHSHGDGQLPPLSPARALGNWLSRDPADGRERLTTDFHLVEGFALLTWDPWLPLTGFGQTVANAAASSQRTGWLVGVSVGAVRAVGGVELGWSYRELQADAALASLADSDFGGTALHAHRVHLRWQPIRNVWLSCSWRTVHPLGASGPTPFALWQADLLWRF